MRDAADVSKDDLRELLGKGWLTHDGMWYYNVQSVYGTDVANDLNKRAIKSMAPFEVERLARALHLEKGELTDAAAIVRFLSNAMSLILPDSVVSACKLETLSADLFSYHWHAGECFAFKGMTRLKVIEKYSCGVMFRIDCWLDALGVKYRARPLLSGCRMYQEGRCEGEYDILH